MIDAKQYVVKLASYNEDCRFPIELTKAEYELLKDLEYASEGYGIRLSIRAPNTEEKAKLKDREVANAR